MIILLYILYSYTEHLWSYIVNRNTNRISLPEDSGNQSNAGSSTVEDTFEFEPVPDGQKFLFSRDAGVEFNKESNSLAKVSNQVSSSFKFEISEEYEHAVYDYDTKKIKFFPPVYTQRYVIVSDILKGSRWNSEIKKVVDIGCAELGFFPFLKSIEGIEKIYEVDINKELLERFSYRVQPWFSDYISDRQHPLEVKLLCGNIGNPDRNLENTDAVTAIELIEHMYPNDLENLIYNIFGLVKPRVAIFTTPNKDFNVLFDDFSGFRHDDHKFEWTREEFESWANNICDRYLDYEVNFLGIGPGPKGQDQYGFCTQAAIFTRIDSMKTPDDANTSVLSDYNNYEVVSVIEFPFTVDNRSENRKVYDEANCYINSCRRNGDYYNYDTDRVEIPLTSILMRMTTCKSMDKLSEALLEFDYKIENREGNNYVILDCENSTCESEDEDAVKPEEEESENVFTYLTENSDVTDWDVQEEDTQPWSLDTVNDSAQNIGGQDQVTNKITISSDDNVNETTYQANENVCSGDAMLGKLVQSVTGFKDGEPSGKNVPMTGFFDRTVNTNVYHVGDVTVCSLKDITVGNVDSNELSAYAMNDSCDEAICSEIESNLCLDNEASIVDVNTFLKENSDAGVKSVLGNTVSCELQKETDYVYKSSPNDSGVNFELKSSSSSSCELIHKKYNEIVNRIENVTKFDENLEIPKIAKCKISDELTINSAYSIDECVESIQKKLTICNINSGEPTERSTCVESDSGIRKTNDIDNTSPPDVGNEKSINDVNTSCDPTKSLTNAETHSLIGSDRERLGKDILVLSADGKEISANELSKLSSRQAGASVVCHEKLALNTAEGECKGRDETNEICEEIKMVIKTISVYNDNSQKSELVSGVDTSSSWDSVTSATSTPSTLETNNDKCYEEGIVTVDNKPLNDIDESKPVSDDTVSEALLKRSSQIDVKLYSSKEKGVKEIVPQVQKSHDFTDKCVEYFMNCASSDTWNSDINQKEFCDSFELSVDELINKSEPAKKDDIFESHTFLYRNQSDEKVLETHTYIANYSGVENSQRTEIGEMEELKRNSELQLSHVPASKLVKSNTIGYLNEYQFYSSMDAEVLGKDDCDGSKIKDNEDHSESDECFNYDRDITDCFDDELICSKDINRQDSCSPDKAGDSGYPNSSNSGRDTMEMDLTPEQVNEIVTESESSHDNTPVGSPIAEEAADNRIINVVGHPPIVHLGDNVENGDVANNNRDGEGNNMLGQVVGEALEYHAIIDEAQEMPLLAAAENKACDDFNGIRVLERTSSNMAVKGQSSMDLCSTSDLKSSSSMNLNPSDSMMLKKSTTFISEVPLHRHTGALFLPTLSKNCSSYPETMSKLTTENNFGQHLEETDTYKMVQSSDVKDIKKYDAWLTKKITKSGCILSTISGENSRKSVNTTAAGVNPSSQTESPHVNIMDSRSLPTYLEPATNSHDSTGGIALVASRNSNELSVRNEILVCSEHRHSESVLAVLNETIDSIAHDIVEELLAPETEPFADWLIQIEIDSVTEIDVGDRSNDAHIMQHRYSIHTIREPGILIQALDDDEDDEGDANDPEYIVEADVKGGGDNSV